MVRRRWRRDERAEPPATTRGRPSKRPTPARDARRRSAFSRWPPAADSADPRARARRTPRQPSPGARVRLRLRSLHRYRSAHPYPADRERLGPVDATAGHALHATSAVCVTGLVVLDTGTYWSGFGQLVILMLIQLGGFGFMTSSTLLLLLLRREATLRERILLREALGSGGLGSVFHLARKVILFRLVAEGTGAIILTVAFLGELDPPSALWFGVFHAISAFNNAGFDVVGGFRSLVPFNHRPEIVLTVAILLIAGGISYTVVEDLVRHRRFVRLTLDSKLVLVTTAALVVLGTTGVLFTEWANAATLGEMGAGPRLLNAFFTAVTPRTAGVNTVDTGAMTENGLFVLIALMFVG